MSVYSPNPTLSPTPTDSVTGLQSVQAVPIKVGRQQSSGVVVGSNTVFGNTSSTVSSNMGARHLQFSLSNLNVFQNLPRETLKGADDMSRMYLAARSGVPDEVKWALKKYLAYSSKAPYIISLQAHPELLGLFVEFVTNLEPLIAQFDSALVDNDATMHTLQAGLSCLLTLRNLAQDLDSIQVLVQNHKIRSCILQVLNKYSEAHSTTSDWCVYSANVAYFNELIHYTLDLMEAISSYIAPARKDDPFFLHLVSILRFTKDRYMVISILRSLSRLLVRSKADRDSAANNLDQDTLSQITAYLLVECDNELVMASLDFLYQYILPGNPRIADLFEDDQRFRTLAVVLPRLLSYNVKVPEYSSLDSQQIELVKRLKPPAPTQVPSLDKQLFDELYAMEEPQRSNTWLKCCFEPVVDSEFTQISLWRAYESKFGPLLRQEGRKLLPAVEFIKNVSTAFSNAGAMVMVDPISGKKRFVIKGIQPRLVALNIPEAIIAAKYPISGLKSRFLDETSQIEPTQQVKLPDITFPNSLSDVSKAAATFICLVSNDSEEKSTKFCEVIKPFILHILAEIPPLNSALSEYMDNMPGI